MNDRDDMVIDIGRRRFDWPPPWWPQAGGVWIARAAVGIILLLYLASGAYVVGPTEAGLVLRFGKHERTTGPGFHYRWPWPVERVVRPPVTEVQRLEIGFKTVSVGPPAKYQPIPAEAQMLTGDENIVDVEFIVQYQVKDAYQFAFRVDDPPRVIKSAAEAAIREVVGRRRIDEVLTDQKAEVQDETRQLLQKLLDRYETGVNALAVQLQDVHPPTPVRDAFKDVASAREDKQKFINEANGYRNDVIPKARGEAQKLLREAEAYQAERVARAEGDAAKFKSILAEYSEARQVTRTRLYLETVESILPQVQIYVVQDDGTLKFLPIGEGARR